MLEYLWLLVVAVVVVAGLGLILWGVKHAVALGINSVIGYFALFAIQEFLFRELVINFWSVLLVALLGIIGLVLVVILHVAGIWF